uniref:ATP synthase F0 subunit 8 n=1 Tax=Zoroaster ophiactis TaxID=467010 RepID=UPI00202856E9|nr:ATP synthase F0 subunit 8 [Zoroaster ophiactis]UPP55895.1 ATP synthase F0 subunit 8 [Zoroaster ophiactis]
MPQLELIYWLFNFILGWITFIIVFSLITNKNIQFLNAQTNNTPLNTVLNNNWLWN